MVSINVPIDPDVPGREQPYMSEELTIADFTPAAKIVLNRIYGGLLAANATLANGAKVDSTARVFAWLTEAVRAAE